MVWLSKIKYQTILDYNTNTMLQEDNVSEDDDDQIFHETNED